eukprot:4292778-Pleurochrysis_carterae.AAC.1
MLQHEGQDANCHALLGAHRNSWLAATPEFEEDRRSNREGGNAALGALSERIPLNKRKWEMSRQSGSFSTHRQKT